MTGFNIVMPGNTAEAVVSPVVKSLVEKSLPNRKGDFFEQLKKVQGVQVNSLSFIGKYNGVSENSKIITSALGIETSNNVNESNKILSEQLCEGNTPETITGNSGESTLLGTGSVPAQDMTPIKVVSMQNEALVLANATKQTGELDSSTDISLDESQQHPAREEQSNYPEQVTLEEDSGQAVVAKRSNAVIDGIVLDSDSSKHVALSGNSVQLPEAELGKQLKSAAGHEDQLGAQVTTKPGTDQPEPTNIHNQNVGKGAEAGQFKLEPPAVQTSSQDILVPVEGNEEVAPAQTNSEPTLEMLNPLESNLDIEQGKHLKDAVGKENQSWAQITKPGTSQPEPTNNTYNQQDSKGPDAGQFNLDYLVGQTRSQDSQVPVEGSEEVVPTRSNSESTLEMLKTVELVPDIQSEPSQQLKGTAGKENQTGAQVTGKPGTAQPEPTNNIHNQQDSKGANAGQFNLNYLVVQTRSQNSQVPVEGSEEGAPTRSNSESTREVLKPIEPIPDTEPGKQPKGAASHENGLATKLAEKGMDIQPSVVDNSRDLSQQVAVASTIAGNREIESGKGKTAGLVDKQAEVDARAMQERSLVQPGRVNHSLNTTKPEFEPTTNDEAGEKADATRKESPSVDVRKLIEFESHCLRGTKLNTFEGSRENLFKEGGDEIRPNLNVLNRSDLEWLRSGMRNPGMETGSRFLTNTREIIDQVVKNAELLLRANVSELKIELKPEFLGRLTIKVALEDGVVIVRLIAENQQVKHMLESNLTSLKQSLESQGIKVERAEVSVQLNNGGMFDGSEDSRQYLWQEHQHSQQHQGKYWGDGVYSNEALEIMEPEGVIEGSEYGINENGNLNFLI